MTAAWAGAGLGLLVAAQVGPVWLLCARTSLRGNRIGALALGLGAATVDLLYAALGVAGAAQALRITAIRVPLGIIGALVLIGLGAGTAASAFRIRMGQESAYEVGRPAMAFRTGLVVTASNPLTIASWAAVFTAASTSSVVTGLASTLAFLSGVGLGSATFFAALALIMGLLARRVTQRALAWADALAGLGLVGFGIALGYRTIVST
jgi:threonine/homoserine/homoserine lactone efflux protein